MRYISANPTKPVYPSVSARKTATSVNSADKAWKEPILRLSTRALGAMVEVLRRFKLKVSIHQLN